MTNLTHYDIVGSFLRPKELKKQERNLMKEIFLKQN